VPPLPGTPARAGNLYPARPRASGSCPGDNAPRAVARRCFPFAPRFSASALRAFMTANPQATAVGALILYHTLGATLCRTARPPPPPLWQASLACAKRRAPRPLRRALGGGPRKRRTISSATRCLMPWSAARSGAAITEHAYDEVWSLISHPDRKIRLAISHHAGVVGPARSGDRGGAQGLSLRARGPANGACFNANQIFPRSRPGAATNPDGALFDQCQGPGTNSARATGEWIAVRSPRGPGSSSAARPMTVCRPGQLALAATAMGSLILRVMANA